ncbi:MAG: hypothetical protein ACOYNY_42975 [Caldilineaceae bacterium]
MGAPANRQDLADAADAGGNSQRYGDQFTVFDFLLGFTRVTMAVFVPMEDETVLEKLSVTETVDEVTVQVVAIGWI